MPPAVIEGGCQVRSVTRGSWYTEMHEGKATLCEYDVNNYINRGITHSLVLRVNWP